MSADHELKFVVARRARWSVPWSVACCLLLLLSNDAFAQELGTVVADPVEAPVAAVAERLPAEMRIRIAWGGGEHVAWRGQIKIDHGEFAQSQCLGREPDAWATVVTQADAIQIQSRRPQSYQALDVTVRAPLTSNLVVEMVGRTTRDGPRTITVPLAQLRDGSFNLPMDAAGNRMLVRRVPGDRLRVSMARDHLVFSPGEDWRLSVQPWLINRDGFKPANLQARVVSARSEQVLWREDAALGTDAQGDWRSLDLSIPVPDREGVYDLVLRATPARGISLLPTENSVEERRVQFVVVDPSLPAVATATNDRQWRETLAFDASQARWWENLTRLPSLRQLSLTPVRMRGEGMARVGRWADRSASVLAPQQWQTYPLPILRPGLPHRIEVEYLGNATGKVPQASAPLGVSVVETTANGSERVTSLDTAMISTPSGGESALATTRVELIFWPQTRSAKVLLTNLGQEQNVSFGRIRLLEGPTRLPPLSDRQSDQGFRTILAHCDDPQFHRPFFASHALDTEAGRELTDWVTFQEGGQRLVEYLRHIGMGGMSLTCVAQGGSLAPLTTIAGIPQHDTGAYFSSGQDAYPKDVLEMLLRMFDREELQLQVGVQFTTPLVDLESYRSANNAIGVELTNHLGQAYRDLTTDGQAAYYNPLDPRVQKSMLQVIREITTRYRHHKSFSGIRIDLSAAGFTHLPGLEWGCDRQTLALFIRDMASELPPELIENLQPSQLLNGPLQPLWIAWRQRRLTDFYASAAAEIRSLRPDARLALHVAPLVDAGVIASASQPGSSSQITLESALNRAGIDLRTLASVEGIDVLRPYRDAPLLSLAERGKSLQFTQSPVWDLLQAAARPAAAITQRSLRTKPIDLDTGRLFGTPSAELQLRSSLSLEDRVYRRALNHALATSDVRSLNVGGDVLLPNRNADLVRWMDVFRRLPNEKFETYRDDQAERDQTNPSNVNPRARVASEGHPVAVATLSIAGRTYLYAVNKSAWSVETTISCRAANDCRFADVSPEGDSAEWERLANGWRWKQRLAPFGLVAQVLTDNQAKVLRVQTVIPETVVPQLQRRLANVNSRLNAMKEPLLYNQLANQGFDQIPPAVEIPGWKWARQPGVNVQRDEHSRYSGAASLRMESSEPVAWVRSEPLPAPRSGRLALQAMLRFDPSTLATARSIAAAPADASVPLRLALEGTFHGQPYYRFAEVRPPVAAANPRVAAGALAGTPGSPQATASPAPLPEWSPFRLQVTDLPVGLEDLRVRFDLMGPGRVWIDDVRLYDLSLTPDEQLEVSKLIGLADYQLRSGRPADCEATLDRFWPLFLSESTTPSTTISEQPAPEKPANSASESLLPEEQRPSSRPLLSRPGWLKRIRRALPR